MKIIRNEQHIRVRRFIAYTFSFAGMAVLLAGMGGLFLEPTSALVIWLPILALPLGYGLAQVGLYFSNRYVRTPRPDERLDESLQSVARDGRLYHFVLPAPHVLLTPAGLIALIPKFQIGDISVEGSKWKQTNVGFMRRMFGQEALGNPTAEAEYRVKQIAQFVSQNVEALREEELPIGAIIVFTSKAGGTLDLRESDIPAMHFTKLKGFWKQRQKDTPLPREKYEALRAALDKAAEEKEAVSE
ncbi:MAG: hypothetical protein KDD89_02835 [Anaerolineales bacterium]|nr:hypothetical protein [Anaerolineales bacterium]